MSQSTSSELSTTNGYECRVDVMIPVLNEAHVLEASVETLRAFLAEHGSFRSRIVIVDNGSTDGTDVVGRRLDRQHDEVQYVHLAKRGRGRALRQAWTSSDADIVCYTDVDLSTELEALPKVIDAIRFEGYHVATGSRLMPGSRTTRSLKREVISRAYNLFVKAVLWTSFSDAQCGFKAISRTAVNDLVPAVKDQSWFFDTELLVLAEKWGYGVKDIPVRWAEDDDSRVKILRTAWEDVRGVFRVRWRLWRDRVTATQSPSRVSGRSVL
jgi:glycosyltransferase involved in cell wall biosynthesis